MKNYWNKLKTTLVILALPMISYGFLGPLEIFFGNEKDFNFWYTDFFGIFVLLSLAVWIVGSLLIALFPAKIQKIMNALILGVGLASYLQNMFMNIKLSEDDGSPMRWETLGNFPTINLLVWIAILVIVIVACVLLKKKWDMVSMAAAGFLSAVQLVAVVSLLLTSIGARNDSGDLQMSGRDQMKVASEENIIVFVLDTYGTTQLEKALEQYPDMLDGLHDFTYYNNADCRYYCTFPSMTHMLTGNEFDFEAELSQDWMSESWQTERAVQFYETLHKEGYVCNLYSAETGYVYGDLANLTGKFDNVNHMTPIVNQKQLVKLMAKMSIYRYVPYVMKPRFEVLTMQFGEVVFFEGDVASVDNNGEFYQKLINERLQIQESEDNALIIQHLFGTHKPYTIDENAMLVEEAEINQTVHGLSVIWDEYLAQLQELGVYDDATIIITADHGSWHGSDPQPIFFIKQSGETHEEMQVNTAPISLADFQATIMQVVGQDSSAYGTSIFEWEPGESRERSVYMRITDDDYPEVPGSSFNVYYGYTYTTDKTELNERIAAGPDEILPATPW